MSSIDWATVAACPAPTPSVLTIATHEAAAELLDEWLRSNYVPSTVYWGGGHGAGSCATSRPANP